jgi:hypothetical protein
VNARQRIAPAAVAAALLLPPAIFASRPGADLETQHVFDFDLRLTPRLELTLHSRVRTQPRGLDFYQARAGPVLYWSAASRVTLIGGYYYAQQERMADRDFIAGHRFFGGGEVRVAGTRRVALGQRVLAERFLSAYSPDFTRYRARTQLTAAARVQPYLGHEIFFDAKGWRSGRTSSGVRWSPGRNVRVDLGYIYEHRRQDIGRDRHLWVTSVGYEWGSDR